MLLLSAVEHETIVHPPIIPALMTANPQQTPGDETIYFTSLNYAVQLGQFDGVTNVKALRPAGDFGLGSEARLKGEVVVLDGIFYSIDSNGKARVMEDEDSISYAALKSFRAECTTVVKNVSSIKALEEALSEKIQENAFAAIKIRAAFRFILFRSFEEEQEPFRPVDQIPEIKFERRNITGTLVGFYTPKSAEVLNSPTYHFHFIDDARTTGGHVLDINVAEASVEIDYAREIHIKLPAVAATEHVDLNTKIK